MTMKYKTYKTKTKEIRIYKWENKLFKDFPMPAGFDWCEYFDFVELVNNSNFEFKEFPVIYLTKNQFQRNFGCDWFLSRVYLSRNGVVISNYDDLQDFSDGGRVVVSRNLNLVDENEI